MIVRRAPAGVVALAAALGLAGPARADTGDTFAALGYVTAVGGGALATAVNGSYLAFGEPAPRHWRIVGYVAGGVDVALGGVLLGIADQRSERLVLGGLSVAVGAAALATAWFVDEEAPRPGAALRATPVLVPHGAGIAVTARF